MKMCERSPENNIAFLQIQPPSKLHSQCIRSLGSICIENTLDFILGRLTDLFGRRFWLRKEISDTLSQSRISKLNNGSTLRVDYVKVL